MRVPDRVVYGITAGVSADKLLRGHLAAMREDGWDVHLAVDPDDRARAAAARERVWLEPLPMAREISLRDDLASLRAWLALLRKLRPSVTNVSTPKAGLLGGIAAWVTRVPRRVYVVRGLRLEGARGLLGRILWVMERISVACATDVVVVSRSLGDEARRRRLLGKKPTWIVGGGSSNGVDTDAVAQRAASCDRVAERRRLGFAETDAVIGYVGRITADKGLDTLLDAAALLPDATRVRLLLIGSLDEEPLGRRIAQLGERVVHVDWTDDVWSYYGVMDALCLPTRREGFPNVVLEASAAALPVITTRATGAVDSVIDGETGLLVDVDDVPDLARALTRLADDPNSRRRFGHAAQARVRSEFDPTSIWAGVASVMRGKPAPHVHRL